MRDPERLAAVRHDGVNHPSATLAPNSFTRRVLVVAVIAVGAVLLLAFLAQAIEVLLVVFGGILVAVFLHALRSLLSEHTPLPEGWSLAVVLLLLVALIVAGALLMGPQVADQVNQLVEQLPRAAQQLRAQIEQYQWGRQILARVAQPGEAGSGQAGAVSSVTGAFSGMARGIANLVLMFAVGIYLAADPRLYRRGLLRLIPPGRRDRASEIVHAIAHTLRGWLLGQMLAMLVVGILTTLGLWLLDVPLALVLGLLAALAEFVPNFGPIVAGVPSVLLALTESPTRALYVALLYVAIQLAESYLITPLVQKRAVELPPALTIAGQILLGVLFGTLGLIFAVPLLATALVLVKMLYVEDVLGEPIKVPGEHHEEEPSSEQAQYRRA